MSEKTRVRLNCPRYWPKLKPDFPCDDCPYGDEECDDECPRFRERRDALGAEEGSCPTCANGPEDCIWRHPPPALRALLAEDAPEWQIRRWLREWLKQREK